MSLLASSCLVVGSPDFTDEPTKPVLVRTEPPTDKLICVKKTDNKFLDQSFKVFFESYDAGEDLTAALVKDYGVANLDEPYTRIQETSVTAGTGEVALSWPLGMEVAGTCHSITMLVVRHPYAKPPYNFCPTDDHYFSATWFVALADDNDVCDFSDCPSTVNNANPLSCPDSLKTPAGGAP
ncbi:MAG: hypothetical protein R3B72_02095 [Polyangiaceae bacterium]